MIKNHSWQSVGVWHFWLVCFAELMKMSHLITKPTKWLCAQQRLRSAWAPTQSDQSSLFAHVLAKDPRFLHADSKESDQTRRMPRLIWVFPGRTCHIVGFIMRQLKCIPLFVTKAEVTKFYSFQSLSWQMKNTTSQTCSEPDDGMWFTAKEVPTYEPRQHLVWELDMGQFIHLLHWWRSFTWRPSLIKFIIIIFKLAVMWCHLRLVDVCVA